MEVSGNLKKNLAIRYLEKVNQSKVDEATKKVWNVDLHAVLLPIIPKSIIIQYSKWSKLK